MRLALLAPLARRTPPRRYGPREKLVSLLCEGLVARGIDVTLFASEGSETQGKLVAVCPTPDSDKQDGGPDVWEALHISRLRERAGDFDLIHSHAGFLPLSSGRLLHVPMVTTLYDPPAPHVLPFFQPYAEGHYYVATSVASRSPDLDYTATVYPGIDLATASYAERPGEYLVFYGRLHPEENVTTALELARRSGMKLVLVGPVEDHAYFETEITPHLDQGQIEYAGEEEMAARENLLAAAYALLVPNRKAKAFCLSAVEAMACGTPVVACDTGAMPEIVRHGETGYLVADMAEAAEKLPHIPALERRRCRQWVEERFSLARMVDEYIEVYDRILKREKPRAHHASPPWGRWEVLLDEPSYKVKRITVLPDKRLSYQKHFKREEHWTVVQGQALVTLDDREIPLGAGETIAIPREAAHRIANPGPDVLVFIEVQRGTYFGEDDIVRLQDDYGRSRV